MRSARLAATIAAVASLVAACAGDGDDDGADDATATPGTTPSPAATATRVPPPPRPASFDDYADEIARYLTADPGAGEGLACLSELFEAWQMPYFSGGRSCRVGNADADDETEVAVVLVETAGPTSDISPDLIGFNIVVLDRDSSGGYRVAYDGKAPRLNAGQVNELGNVILDIADVNGDDVGELVYAEPWCGAHTCGHTVRVVQGTSAGYRALTPSDGLRLETSIIRLEDTDGDGTREIVMHGGRIDSAAAGPQRERTDTYAWNGTIYALRSSIPDPAVFRYHAVVDADALFAVGDYDAAEQAYVRAATEPSLTDVGRANERAELAAYALYRAGLAVLAANGDPARAGTHFTDALANAGTLNAGLAGAFSAAYDASGSVAIACSAVLEDLQLNAEEFAQFWDFGYANPAWDPAKVCPF